MDGDRNPGLREIGAAGGIELTLLKKFLGSVIAQNDDVRGFAGGDSLLDIGGAE